MLPPEKVADFLHTLPTGKIPGVGKVTQQKMQRFGVHTVGDLLRFERGELVNLFGKWGYRLYDLARGIDNRSVKPSRERLQISTEITLPEDLPLADILQQLPHLAEDLWQQAARKKVQFRSITLKLKTADFRILTRSQTFSAALPDTAALLAAAQQTARRMPAADTTYRLIGLGVSHLEPLGQQIALWQEEE